MGTETNGTGGGLLAGVRVVELGGRIAAPIVGMLLAEQGAEVVRVPTGTDGGDDPLLAALLARGKAEAAAAPDGERRALVERLVAQADVVVSEGTAARALGFDARFAAIRAGANPGLVSCHVAPFPEGDPRNDGPTHEAVVGVAGYLYDRPFGSPRYHGFPVGSVMAGIFAANAIVAALYARLDGEGAATRPGQHVDTTLLGGGLFAQILQVLIKTGVPRGFLPLKMVATPFMRSWRCADGRYVYLHVTLPAHNARLLALLDELGQEADARALRDVISPATARDPSQVGSTTEAAAIVRCLTKTFLARPAAEWERLLGSELCCIRVRTVGEWLDDARAAGMPDACDVDDPVFGPVTAPGPGVTIADHPPRLAARRVGSDVVADTLARWEADPRPQGAAAAAAGTPGTPPLAGMRVADLSRIIAGPCAARVLAELGAEVVSVQRPTDLDWALSFHLVFNAGKRSVTLDFTTEEGREQLSALLDDLAPDVFLQNYRNLDVARSVGLDPDTLRERFPGLVYTHLNAYGNEGDWRERPGFEQVVQAVSGIQSTYGGDGRPRLLPTPVIDIGSGLLGAFGSLLGLYHRRRTGEGAFAATHLTRVSVLLQAPMVAAVQREAALAAAAERSAAVDWDPEGVVAVGLARALDGHFFVVGPRRDLRRWLDHVGLPAPTGGFDGDVLAAAGARTWRRTVAQWQRTLAAAGLDGRVAILPAPKMRRLLADHRLDGAGVGDREPLVRKRAWPGCPKPLTFLRSPFDLSGTPRRAVPPPPVRGGDTRAVLTRVGAVLEEDAGVVPYPDDKPLVLWLADVARWGWFAWRSGAL